MSSKRLTVLFGSVLLAIALTLVAVRPGHAQVLYGSIVGSVTDASQAGVPGAAVKVTETATNQTREARTSETGFYTLATVPAGSYQVSISREGFKTFTAANVRVNLNTVVRVDAVLEVGQLAESVEVTSQSAALQTDRADVHSEVNAAAIANLPQATRTYQGIVQNLPGVAPPSASSGGTNNPSKSMVFSANGTSQTGTNIRIEGVSATNPWVQFYSSYVPSMDAIEVINVVTDSADAEQGLVNGAAVNVQLKSGTNSFHGSAYEYNVDSAFKSRPFFLPASQGIPKLVDNDFGFTLGGHIIRNKLFYFGSYELDMLRQGNATLATVPTAAIRSGDMSASPNPIYDPSTGNADGTGRSIFPGNVIPNARISPIAAKIVALVPAQNIPGVLTSNYYVNTPTSYNLHKVDSKFDWNTTSKLRISTRVADQPYNDTTATVFGPVLGGSNNAFQYGYTFASSTSATYVASPTLVIDASFGMQYVHQYLYPPGTDKKYGSDVLGIPGTNLGDLPHAGGMPQFNISSYSGYGYSYTPLEYKQPTFEYTGNVSWVRGAHNIRFGVDSSQQHMNHFEVSPTQFSFSGGVTSLNGGPGPNQFNSYADFLLGSASSDTNSLQTVPWITLRTWEHSLYIRDQWQVNRKLTVNYGVRWEYFPVVSRADRGIERFDFTTNKQLVCGVGSTPKDCGITVSHKLFAPRVGIAYRPTENFVIRMGYALNPEQINMYRDGIYSYPTELTYNASGVNSWQPATTLAQGIPVLSAPDISAGSVTLPKGATFTTDPQNFIRGYSQSWNFTLQKELFRGWIGQAGYVGTNTIHQHTRYNINYGQIGGGAASQPFYQLFGITGSETLIMPLETMHYSSLQATLEHRFAHGFQFLATYTRSKWIGLCCDERGDGQPAIPIPQYMYLSRALMPSDRPNNFRISSVYELPFGNGKPMLQNGVAAAIAGGWQLNGVLSVYSGSPFSVSAAGASLNAPGSTQRADQVKSNVAILGNVGSTGSYFDPLAFVPVTSARFGTAGFDSLRGPGVRNLDLSIFRTFKLTERFALQFRAETLNLTNTPHFGNPGGNVSNLQMNSDGTIKSLGGYTQITGVSAPSRITDERYFRFGLRLTF